MSSDPNKSDESVEAHTAAVFERALHKEAQATATLLNLGNELAEAASHVNSVFDANHESRKRLRRAIDQWHDTRRSL